MQKQNSNLGLIVFAMLAGAAMTAAVVNWPRELKSEVYADQQSRAQAAQQNLQNQNLSTALDLSTAFRNVAEAIKPSVVSISTSREVAVSGGRRGGIPPQFRRQLPPGFEDFFEFDFDQFERRGDRSQTPSQRRLQTGSGSGVIVRADGYILTNNHVVARADKVTVELSDGREIDAEIVGTDPETDIAVLKVDAGGLEPVRFGNSDQIQVGDWVLAIGSPFGLDQTVTAGIISGKNRVQGIVGDGNGFEDFLQTDAAINPGNSGGPLVNLRGELVGINTAIASRSGGNNGIGFAIPVAMARPIFESILNDGEVRRGFLGAGVGDVNGQTIEQYDLNVTQGALISAVLDNMPAARAGLQPGDVVTKLDGRPVRSGTQLRNYIASRPPGSTVQMEVNRSGDVLNLTVELKERTEEAMAMFGSGDGDSMGAFGAEVEPLTPETAAGYGYEKNQEGLIVTAVQDGGIAARAGIQAGDVLLSVNGVQVQTAQKLEQAIAKSKGSTRIQYRRGNVVGMTVIN